MILENQIGISVHSFLQQQDRRGQQRVPSAIYQAFYFSAYMFDLAILRRRPTSHHVFAIVLRHLALILSPISTIGNVYYSTILFWTFSSAVVFGEDGPDESFFQERLRTIAQGLGIKTWENAREILQKVTWIPRYCEEWWRSIWNKTIHDQGSSKSYQQPKEFQQGWKSFPSLYKDDSNIS
jgi:hypothetical protein